MTLIIAMIFLLILTLLGVTAMQSTVVEERIAGNTRDKDMAFQSAEDGLRAAEVYLAGNACTPGIAFVAAPGAGLVNNVNGAAGVAFQYSSANYWLAQPWNAGDSRASGTALAGIVAPARYVIELISGTSGLQAGASG
ncbi:MAG: PilX N-terminal domain-containing pilus assembly protein, partial [Sulfuriferula sp.]